jgi:methenyltetrahydromethanopterin cyclohydrolase
MDSLNRMAVELVDEALEFRSELNVEAYELDGGATVLDFGVEADGGLEAGLLLAEIQAAGLSSVQSRMGTVAGAAVPYVDVSTDQPALALLCSAKAGWELSVAGTGDGEGDGGEGRFDGLGSGPARALVAEEAEFDALGYRDEFDLTVLTVESITLPDDRVARRVAERAGVEQSGVYLPTYAVGSPAGSAATAARAAELAVFRLFEVGYDPADVLTAAGSAPVAPVSYDETEAMARTNDAIAYGGRVHLHVREPFDRFGEITSTVADDYGTTFAEVFETEGYDFEAIPESVFAPAQVTVDVADGPTHVVGETDETALARSFGFHDGDGDGGGGDSGAPADTGTDAGGEGGDA